MRIESPGAAFFVALMIGFALALPLFGAGVPRGPASPAYILGWAAFGLPFIFGALMAAIAVAKRWARKTDAAGQ